MLQHFKDYIGEFPPTAQLAKSFLAQYSNHKPRTLYRYFMMIKPFMKWYGDPIDDIKVKIPRSLSPNTPGKNIEVLIHAIETKRSAKHTIERGVLMVLIARYVGLRREEISNLKARDITEDKTFVREGKGAKDRCIPMSSNIKDRLLSLYIEIFHNRLRLQPKLEFLSPMTYKQRFRARVSAAWKVWHPLLTSDLILRKYAYILKWCYIFLFCDESAFNPRYY